MPDTAQVFGDAKSAALARPRWGASKRFAEMVSGGVHRLIKVRLLQVLSQQAIASSISWC
jgi:hypothetical protein